MRFGVRGGTLRFAPETAGDPLGYFPELKRGGVPYNLRLSEEVLERVLRRWEGAEFGGWKLVPEVAGQVEWASERCREAFREVLPGTLPLGDPALLAVVAVTANLQRTLATLGGLLISGHRSGNDPEILLSRQWCGLFAYPPDAPYFPAAPRSPAHPARLHPRRRDPRHLGNALWCSLGSIQSRCESAIELLRHEFRRSGIHLR